MFVFVLVLFARIVGFRVQIVVFLVIRCSSPWRLCTIVIVGAVVGLVVFVVALIKVVFAVVIVVCATDGRCRRRRYRRNFVFVFIIVFVLVFVFATVIIVGVVDRDGDSLRRHWRCRRR